MRPEKGGPRLLVTDRESAIYLERARVHVADRRVVYYIEDDERRREFNIPHVNLAVLFLGQGTSVSQDAVRLLAEEGVHVAVTGSGGTPLHMGSLTVYRSTAHFRALLPIYLDDAKSLAAAKVVMRHRAQFMRTRGAKLAKKFFPAESDAKLKAACAKFETAIAGATSIGEVLGHEGAYARRCYAEFARMSRIATRDNPFVRRAGGETGKDDKPAAVRANALVDHGNYLAYGMSGAALWALGVPPHMSLFHGKTRAGGLVFDIADGFKDALVLPIAFGLAKKKTEAAEALFRAKLLDAFDDSRILKTAIAIVDEIVSDGAGGQAA